MHSKIQRFFSKLEKHSVKVYDFNEIKIEESLGEGGFGEVYKGYVCGKKRALKRLFFEMDELDGFLCDLLKEMVYSKDLVSKKNLETYFGFGFENCCLAFKIYASDKRLSKYNFLNIQHQEFNQMYWEKMISIENKSRINFEFELKGLTGANKRINRFFSNAIQDL